MFKWLVLSVWKNVCLCVQINSVLTTTTRLRPWKEVPWIKHPPPHFMLSSYAFHCSVLPNIPVQLCSHFVYRNADSGKLIIAFTSDNCLDWLSLSSGSCRGVKFKVIRTSFECHHPHHPWDLKSVKLTACIWTEKPEVPYILTVLQAMDNVYNQCLLII